MKITVLGCGNSFSVKNYNSSFLLEENESKLLIDCGNLNLLALHNAGIDPKDITDIYVSHKHSDHCGGLENMAFYHYDWKNKPKVRDKDYVPNLIVHERLLPKLWENTLKGGLQSIEGFETTLETYFNVFPVKDNEYVKWQGWNIQLIQQMHTMNGSSYNEAFGLLMSKMFNESIYFTTDGIYTPQLNWIYNEAGLIFQDCECTPFASGAHANFNEISSDISGKCIDPKNRGKIWLTHYQDFVSDNKDFNGNPFDWNKAATDAGFNGFVTLGQVIEPLTYR